MAKSNLILARDLNGWTLEVAALRVGYKGGRSGLFKLEERSKDDASLSWVTGRVLQNLSKGYGVSIEYLMGLTNDPELSKSDIERGAVLRAVHDSMKEASCDMALKVNNALVNAIKYKNMRDDILGGIKGLLESSERLISLNTVQFEEDLKGGANFQRHLNSVVNIIRAQEAEVMRLSRIAEMKAQSDVVINESQQVLDLSFENKNL